MGLFVNVSLSLLFLFFFSRILLRYSTHRFNMRKIFFLLVNSIKKDKKSLNKAEKNLWHHFHIKFFSLSISYLRSIYSVWQKLDTVNPPISHIFFFLFIIMIIIIPTCFSEKSEFKNVHAFNAMSYCRNN